MPADPRTSLRAAQPTTRTSLAAKPLNWPSSPHGSTAAVRVCAAARLTCAVMNTTMYATYPCAAHAHAPRLRSRRRLKMWMLFEHGKTEYDGGIADFRDCA